MAQGKSRASASNLIIKTPKAPIIVKVNSLKQLQISSQSKQEEVSGDKNA